MPEETPPHYVHLDLFYGVPAWLLALLLAKPGRRPLGNLVAKLHQEHRGGCMGVALIVPPGQAGELYHVASAQTGIAEPDALIRVHSQARVVVVVQGAAERDLTPPPNSRPSQPLG